MTLRQRKLNPSSRKQTGEKHQGLLSGQPQDRAGADLSGLRTGSGETQTQRVSASRESTAVSTVTALPEELRELVERMLTEGATFEDTQDALAESGGPTVTLQALQNHFRGNLEIQKRRIEYQLERARLLKEAFAHPETAEAQLANAAILTGLQSLTRRGAELSVKDSLRARLERENLLLKQDLTRLKLRREQEDQQFRKTRLHAEITKWQLAKMKLLQLRRELMRGGKTKSLGPEAMEKIQEIYGLLRIPLVPRDPAPPEQAKL